MNNNILSGRSDEGRSRDRRSAISNLFREDNPAFEVCLRNLQDRELPNNDRVVLRAYEGEPRAAQIERFCLNLQSVLFTLSVFPEVDIANEVLDGFFDMTGKLIYALHHLADYDADDAGEGVPRLRCAPSGLRVNEVGDVLAGRKKAPALALLRLLRGGSL